jgi:hypothetical protein
MKSSLRIAKEMNPQIETDVNKMIYMMEPQFAAISTIEAHIKKALKTS